MLPSKKNSHNHTLDLIISSKLLTNETKYLDTALYDHSVICFLFPSVTSRTWILLLPQDAHSLILTFAPNPFPSLLSLFKLEFSTPFCPMIFQKHSYGKLQLQKISTGHYPKIHIQQFALVSNVYLTWLGHKLRHFTTYFLKCHLPMAFVTLLSLLPSYFCPGQTSLLHSRSVYPTSIWPFLQGYLTVTSNPSVWNRIYHHSNTDCPPTSTSGISTSRNGATTHLLISFNPSHFFSLHIQLMTLSYRIVNVLKSSTSLHDHFYYPGIDTHHMLPGSLQ